MESRIVFSGIQINWLAVFAGVFCLTMALGASAEEKAGPCDEDIATLCKGIEPGGGRIAECIKKHTNELSPACKKGLEDADKTSKIEKNPEFMTNCKSDVKEHCKGIAPGGGRIVKCLKQHESDLYSECQEMLK
jgi:hypothetical protein